MSANDASDPRAMPPPRLSFLELVDDVREEVARLNAEVRGAREELEVERAVKDEALRLLRWAVSPTGCLAVEEQVGRDIADFLRVHGPVIV